MILVTAATGQVGSAVLAALAKSNCEVRALVRNPSTFLALENTHVLQGDFADAASLARAFDGVSVLFLAGRDNPDSVEQHRRVLEQAELAGVRHIVKLSAIGASSTSAIGLMREHYEVDQLVLGSSADWTFIKPHLFMQNLLRAGESVRTESKITAPMAATAFPLVDTRDVGEVAALVLSDPTSHVGREYTLTGPAAVTYDDVASALTKVAGRTIRYEAIEQGAFEARLLAAGMPDWRAFDLSHIAQAYGPHDNAVSQDIPALLGRPARSLAAFMDDHKDAFHP
ncbi:MAG: NmrA family NAD(P)-binding protein [Alphaproteobacteria bacterium]